MKVAHICLVTPRRCGLYETTRELVAGLRTMGVDSRLVDIPQANKVYPSGYPHTEDRGALVASMQWAVTADVVVNHSGYDNTPIAETGQPIVHVAHGRPRSSFLSEVNGTGAPIYSYHYGKNADPRWRAVVTFWPEHKPYLEVMFPAKPVRVVQAPVDLEAWTPGPARYDFHGQKAEINVVCTDMWREDVDPFLPLNAFALWARGKQAKLHLYAKPANLRGYSALIKRLQDDGTMGVCHGRVEKGLDEIYRAADFVLTANEIDTRTVREAKACGCPVVRVGTDLSIPPSLPSRERVRQLAEIDFDPRVTALQFKRVLDDAMA